MILSSSYLRICALGLILAFTLFLQDLALASPKMPMEQMEAREVCGLFSSPDSHQGGGTVRIKAARVSLEEGSTLSAEAGGQVNGGDVCILANSFKSTQKGHVTVSNQGSGDAGRLLLVTNQLVDLEDDSVLEAISQGKGPGGDLVIFTELYEARSNSMLMTDDKGDGDAGELLLVADRVLLDDNSDVMSRDEGDGNGGSITISTNRYIARRGSDIRVSDLGTGEGGRIDLIAQGLAVLGEGSSIDAQVPEQDLGGDISILANTLIVSSDSQLCPGPNGELSVVTFQKFGDIEPAPCQSSF